jgi:hypothetical protein
LRGTRNNRSRRSAVGAPQALEAFTRLRIETVADPAGAVLAMLDRFERRGELARADLRNRLTGSPSDGRVRGDEAHPLAVPGLRSQPLQQSVGMRSKAHLERAVALVGSRAVEDDDTAGPADRNEARQGVDQLLPLVEAGGAEDVVAVEQVEGRIRQRDASAPRTPAAPQRR